jgi:hypothetical protein
MTKIEHYGHPLPNFTRYLSTWGEARIINTSKDGKNKDQEVTGMFVGYTSNHEGDCYKMRNPKTKKISETRDVVFLKRMFFRTPMKAVPNKQSTDNGDHDSVQQDKRGGTVSADFVISGHLDSDYAKKPNDRRSVLGHVVYLEGAPTMFKSSTERTVPLSTTKAETYAGVTFVQDMLYMKNVLESLGLRIKLPIILEMDNQGAVYLANNWSIGGRTRHIDVKSVFLRELKEAGVLVIKWIAGAVNEAYIFAKNLDGPAFQQYTRVFIGGTEDNGV